MRFDCAIIYNVERRDIGTIGAFFYYVVGYGEEMGRSALRVSWDNETGRLIRRRTIFE